MQGRYHVVAYASVPQMQPKPQMPAEYTTHRAILGCCRRVPPAHSRPAVHRTAYLKMPQPAAHNHHRQPTIRTGSPPNQQPSLGYLKVPGPSQVPETGCRGSMGSPLPALRAQPGPETGCGDAYGKGSIWSTSLSACLTSPAIIQRPHPQTSMPSSQPRSNSTVNAGTMPPTCCHPHHQSVPPGHQPCHPFHHA